MARPKRRTPIEEEKSQLTLFSESEANKQFVVPEKFHIIHKRKDKTKEEFQFTAFSESKANRLDKALREVSLTHRRNFGIEIPYLLSLSEYNNYFKKPHHKNLEDDSLLLRLIFAGIKNSPETPAEIFDGLNALEICLMEAGIKKRKYVDDIPFLITFKGQEEKGPREIKRNSEKYAKESKIKIKGHLDNKDLYEIVNYLLNASNVKNAYSKCKRQFTNISQLTDLSREQQRFKRVNAYDPLTLKQRMDYIEAKYSNVLLKFKEVLSKPFIPERILGPVDWDGNPRKIINPEGFITPGKNYRKGRGNETFHRLGEYARLVYNYFQRKEDMLTN